MLERPCVLLPRHVFTVQPGHLDRLVTNQGVLSLTRCQPPPLQEVGFYDQEKNNSGVLTAKLSADALAVKGQFGDTMGMLTQVSMQQCKSVGGKGRLAVKGQFWDTMGMLTQVCVHRASVLLLRVAAACIGWVPPC